MKEAGLHSGHWKLYIFFLSVTDALTSKEAMKPTMSCRENTAQGVKAPGSDCQLDCVILDKSLFFLSNNFLIFEMNIIGVLLVC